MVGATCEKSDLLRIKNIVDDEVVVLSPGVGAQGGGLDVLKIFGKNTLINVSRGIISAENPKTEAKKYCEDFSAGGYSDWRLPDIKELATLYTDGVKEKEDFRIAGQIKITDCCIWSSYDVLGGALSFSYKSGKRIPSAFAETYQLRALPVRGTSKIDLSEYKNF